MVLSAEQFDLLERHYDLLVRWNRRINLTRLGSLDDIVQFHFFESLFLAQTLGSEPLNIADVGSGAGFPGIPLAVVRPDCKVRLIESHQRKAVFLREAGRGLSNLDVISSRAEDVTEEFDLIVSRAVRPKDVLSLALSQKAALLISGKEMVDIPEPAQIISIPRTSARVIATFHVEHAKIDKRG